MLTGWGRVCFESKGSHDFHTAPRTCPLRSNKWQKYKNKFRDSETCLWCIEQPKRKPPPGASEVKSQRFLSLPWMPLTFMLPWNVQMYRDLFCSSSSGDTALSGSWFTSVVRISLPWLTGFGAIKIPQVTCCLLTQFDLSRTLSRTWEDIRLVRVTQEVNDLM